MEEAEDQADAVEPPDRGSESVDAEESVEKLGFLDFLEDGNERGGFKTDDVLAAVLPLIDQMIALHESGKVAPLEGLSDLHVTHGHLWFENAAAKPVQSAPDQLKKLQRQRSRAFDVVGSHDLTHDLDDDLGGEGSNLLVAEPADHELKAPLYLTRYCAWEHLAGHHDALTDIFSLGMLMASLGLGLDFCDREALTSFVESRSNLFRLNPQLHPSVAAIITRMTDLNRHDRIQDLGTIRDYLENYRDQPDLEDLDFSRISGFENRSRNDKRTLIHERLRDRLFELTRRNRLVYFRSTLQTVNLTEGSVPLLLDFENIRPEQLFTWHADLADSIRKERTISLNRYLRFEDAPWLPSALDGIRRDANRDIKEYGFAQLRLVIVFLRWHNLKEDKAERIHSPLLLLPVSLKKKKGIRDSNLLEPSGTIAELNPALRFFLKQLYDLDLPESIDLAETSVDEFYEFLRRQIQASEPAIELKKIERPQIDLVYEKAKKRLDQYQKRRRMSGRSVRTWENIDYSYKSENFQPLGLQLFLKRVKPTPLPLDYLLSEKPLLRTPGISEGGAKPVEPLSKPREKIKKRELYRMREGSGSANNPYAWDFDLCALTLGNFNYRKMTLVRDYNTLLEEDRENSAFDEVFSLEPKDREQPPPAPDLKDQFLIVPSDPTQVSAITWSRTGRNLIIQGPPGTGKSQTITNLIADYVARGKRVLFVCEKRAALDVVYHRIGQSGLDRLACLIHDSQADKKAFIMDLKATYEGFMSKPLIEDQDSRCDVLAESVGKELKLLEQFAGAMNADDPSAAVSLRALLERLIVLRESEPEIGVELEERLPPYRDWLEHGEKLKQLTETLRDLGEEPVFAASPLSALGKESFTADNPVSRLRGLLDETGGAVREMNERMAGLSWDLSDFTFREWLAAASLSSSARYLTEGKLLSLLDPGSGESKRLGVFERKIDAAKRKLEKARERTVHWREKLSARDAEAAHDQARMLEGSIFRFLQPAFWRLRKVMAAHYDFSAHAVTPRWTQVLRELDEEHQIVTECEEIDEEICVEFDVDDADALRHSIEQFSEARNETEAGRVRDFCDFVVSQSEANSVVDSLAGLESELKTLDGRLARFLREHGDLTAPELADRLEGLRENLETLPELLPDLNDLVKTPEAFYRAIGELDWSVEAFEAGMARKSLDHRYREDRNLGRFEGWMLRRHAGRAEQAYRRWMKENGARIVNRVHGEFLESYRISTLPAAQLTSEQKDFKKDFNKGRRELEHEFGKTMRYKSIRDLASGSSGRVVLQLKPIWLMSPLSISDALPLETGQFDVVIFDEASQIKLEEAVPTIFRAAQIIVVGDEMQLPPTNFFSASSKEDEVLNIEEAGEVVEYDLGAESFLSQSARNLPSTLLGWHYRSRHEALISFSNNAFYSGELLTIPDRKVGLGGDREIRATSGEEAEGNLDEILARSISFHFLEHGVYESRRNPAEADYIARSVRALLERGTGLSIGIVAFSEAQQDEIEGALNRLGRLDEKFGNRLAEEFEREEDDQFCGLFVKNLENVQGDERDVIILSVCYAPDANGSMRMNFGPINQAGGEKRLNVIFSRSKIHMVVVSSIHHHQITNDYNDGANCLKGFLEYAAAVSRGDAETGKRVLGMFNNRTEFGPQESRHDPVVQQIAEALSQRGLEVESSVGQSRFKADLAVREPGARLHQVAVMVDGEDYYRIENPLERYLQRPGILRAFGWTVIEVLAKDWYHAPEDVLNKIERLVRDPEEGSAEEDPGELNDDHDSEEPTEEVEELESAEQVKQEDPEAEEAVPDSENPDDPVVELEEEDDSEETDDGDQDSGTAQEPTATRRYLEFKDDRSSKFWEITWSDVSYSVRFGRIGTQGQSRTKEFATPEAAESEAQKQIRSKLNKGYVEKTD